MRRGEGEGQGRGGDGAGQGKRGRTGQREWIGGKGDATLLFCILSVILIKHNSFPRMSLICLILCFVRVDNYC